MYCIMIETNLNSASKQLSAIQRQDYKSLVLRSLRDHIPDVSISFVGDGIASNDSKWVVLAHSLEMVSSKTITVLEKGLQSYASIYGNPKLSISVMQEQ